jgi:hypothetical protein
MRLPIKFPGTNTVLHQDELDPLDLQAGFLLDLPAQGAFGRFAELDLAPRDAP